MTIEEKLALLQGLFLQRAAVDGQIKNLIEASGVGDTLSDETVEEHEPPVKRKARKVKSRRVVAKRRGRPPKKRLDAETKDAILEEFRSGENTINGLSRKYKIPYQTIWVLCKRTAGAKRAKGNSGEPLKLSTRPLAYVCPAGHRFKSKFPMSHARCPDCHQLANVRDEDSLIEEDEI